MTIERRLLDAEKHRPRDLRKDPTSIPVESSGLYAWWFVHAGVANPIPSLLYVGKAQKSLRKRILDQHLGGTARRSTLRKSLAALLTKQLRLINERPGEGPIYNQKGEDRLSRWMDKHPLVSIVVLNDPKSVEKDVIRTLSPPLNLEYNGGYPTKRALSNLRKKAKQGKR